MVNNATHTERLNVIELHAQGVPYSKIADEAGISISQRGVHRIELYIKKQRLWTPEVLSVLLVSTICLNVCPKEHCLTDIITTADQLCALSGAWLGRDSVRGGCVHARDG